MIRGIPRSESGRRRSRLVLAVIAGLVVAGAGLTALAAAKPLHSSVAITFKHGKPSTFAGTRFDGEYVASLKRVYFLGFRDINNATDGSIWYYDTVAKTYTDTGLDMPVPVSNYGIAALTDSRGLGLYIFGGRDDAGNIVTNVQAYYPDTNTTRQFTHDPWPGTTPAGCVSLPAMGVAVANNTAVVMGGLSFSANGCADDQSAQTWLFDPTAGNGLRWTQGRDLKVARGYITPAVIGKKIYAIGGDTNDAGSLIPQQTVEAATLGRGWNDGNFADLPEACDESQAFAFRTGPLANTITLAGCGQWPNAVPDVLQYDVAGDAWSIVGALNDNRRNHAGASIGSSARPKLYILGGYGEDSGFIDPISTSEIGQPAAAGGSPSAPAAPHSPSGARPSTS